VSGRPGSPPYAIGFRVLTGRPFWVTPTVPERMRRTPGRSGLPGSGSPPGPPGRARRAAPHAATAPGCSWRTGRPSSAVDGGEDWRAHLERSVCARELAATLQRGDRVPVGGQAPTERASHGTIKGLTCGNRSDRSVPWVGRRPSAPETRGAMSPPCCHAQATSVRNDVERAAHKGWRAFGRVGVRLLMPVPARRGG
jgi:hypothetical protein